MSTSDATRPAAPVASVRGACTACGAFYALTPEGTVRGHDDLASGGRCLGSGKKPAVLSQTHAPVRLDGDNGDVRSE